MLIVQKYPFKWRGNMSKRLVKFLNNSLGVSFTNNFMHFRKIANIFLDITSRLYCKNILHSFTYYWKSILYYIFTVTIAICYEGDLKGKIFDQNYKLKHQTVDSKLV